MSFVAAVLALRFVTGCQAPAAQASQAPSPSRPPLDQDRYRRPDLLVAALHLGAGAAVADVGAGSGYLTHRLATRVGPGGRVVATDIDPAALARIGAGGAGEAPITTRVVPADDPRLEPGAYDLILLSEVDHLLGDRAEFLRRLAPALKAGGRIAISNRRAHRAAVLEAARRAQLTIVSDYGGLPAHFLIEVKP